MRLLRLLRLVFGIGEVGVNDVFIDVFGVNDVFTGVFGVNDVLGSAITGGPPFGDNPRVFPNVLRIPPPRLLLRLFLRFLRLFLLFRLRRFLRVTDPISIL